MGDNKSRGNRVVIWIKELNICMTFNHLEFFNPTLGIGDEIPEKEFIGVMGNTGVGTGAHLHLEVMPVDDKANLLYPLNGYLGCIDPLPYL
jgi:murein DD-endopeptidase MepM/ murein hydrolase activator NlpD